MAAAAMNPDLTHLAAIAAALGWASGLRLYAVVFLTGAAGALGWVDLPGGLHILQSPWLLGASGVLLFVEFFVDKIPGLDSVGPLHGDPHSAGAALAAAVFGVDQMTWTTIAALLGGGLAAAPAIWPRRPRAPPPIPRPSRSRTSPCRCSATAWCLSSSGCRGPIRSCSSSPSAWPWRSCWRRSGSWGDSSAALPARWPCAIVGRCLPQPRAR
jgi:hypothetical protein